MKHETRSNPSADRTAIRRNQADGIVEAVAFGGRIRLETLTTLLALLEEKTDYKCHIEVAVVTEAMLKTLDNEADALETIERLKKAPPKAKSKAQRTKARE
jgi:acylphosphatase